MRRRNANGAKNGSGITVNGKIVENQFGVRLSSAEYHDRQWSAPSLETLAREFKDVVKTMHRIRANDENDPTRIGQGLSDESLTAIE